PSALGAVGASVTFNGAINYTGALAVTGRANFAADQTFSSLTLSGGSFVPDTISGTGNITVTGTMVFNSGGVRGSGHLVLAHGATMSLPANGQVKLLARILDNSGVLTINGHGFYFGPNTGDPDAGVLNNLPGGVVNAFGDGSIQRAGGGPPAFNNSGVFTKTGVAEFFFNGVPFNNTGSVGVQAGT